MAFAVIVRQRWQSFTTAQRTLGVTLGVWWLGAWIELVLSQRYSSHYFSVLAMPTHDQRDRFGDVQKELPRTMITAAAKSAVVMLRL